VVNNGIIMLDVINRKRTELETTKSDLVVGEHKTELRELIIEAAASRLRPVLLTAITTVVGIMPLVFAAEIWAPLAYSIIFGLTFATVLTLVLLPAIYYRWPGTLRNAGETRYSEDDHLDSDDMVTIARMVTGS